jgi:RNA polymerase sigma-70 factor (ECF subfamily)
LKAEFVPEKRQSLFSGSLFGADESRLPAGDLAFPGSRNNRASGVSYLSYVAMPSDLDFESLVARYYQSLYQFAFSLSRTNADASDLTQQTFYLWAAKGNQLRDATKVKTWLFSTLHHEFLNSRRRQSRFPHYEISELESELPAISPETVNRLDSAQVLQSLARVDEHFQAPLALFYMEDHSYKEIAEILDVPIGTVKSRIARGIGQLYRQLINPEPAGTEEREKHD